MEKIGTLLWDEFVRLPLADISESTAELCGFLEGLPRRTDGEMLTIACQRLVIGRRLLKLWKGLNERSFNATIDLTVGMLQLDRKRGKAYFKLPIESYFKLVSRDLIDSGNIWSWLRGFWGGCGALYLPQSGYYMTFRVKDGSPAENRLTKLLRSVSITPNARVRNGRKEYTIRDQGCIVTCLSKMGLVKTSLLLEDTAIVRSVKNNVNKLVNCDTANISKTVKAASEQLAAVERIERENLWHCLPTALAELATARKDNPSASFRELGQSLSKPVSKSTVEYRWRKLESLIWGR